MSAGVMDIDLEQPTKIMSIYIRFMSLSHKQAQRSILGILGSNWILQINRSVELMRLVIG